MKINEFMVETFQTVSINGILYSLNTDEKKIYSNVKENGKLMKSELGEYDQRIASQMVTKGLLCRRKNPQHEIYFTTRGRRKCAPNKPIDEVAPPDSQIEKWIEKNKDNFKEKYGKDYKKYLYGKAWNKFNGKKLNESYDETTNDSRKISKYSKGQQLKNIYNGNLATIEDISFYNNQFYYDISINMGIDKETGYPQIMSFKISEKDIDIDYINPDEDYWDGEDE